jgi:hypothetical protein
MPNYLTFAPAISAGVFAAVVALSTDYPARAGECIAEPTHQPAEGRHWYYHVDRGTNQTCWNLGDVAISPQRITPDTTQPHAEVTVRPRIRDGRAPGSTERDTLFREFLRWNELERIAR